MTDVAFSVVESKTCPTCGISFTAADCRQPTEFHKRIFCSAYCALHRPKPSLEKRFWAKVDKRGPDECWEWLGTAGYRHGSKSYGKIGIGGSGNMAPTHRVSWELHFGPIPDGLHVLHRCDNPPCVNPSHLFLGTVRDNSLDCVRKGRHRRLRGEQSPSAKFSDAVVAAVRRRYAAGGVTQVALAREYQMSQPYLSQLICGVKRSDE